MMSTAGLGRGVNRVNPLDWSLVDGWLPITFTILGFGAVVAIMARRGWAWWIRVVPVTVTACTVATAAALLVIVVVAEQANAYFSAFPTLRAALGRSSPVTPFEQVAAPVPDV